MAVNPKPLRKRWARSMRALGTWRERKRKGRQDPLAWRVGADGIPDDVRDDKSRRTH